MTKPSPRRSKLKPSARKTQALGAPLVLVLAAALALTGCAGAPATTPAASGGGAPPPATPPKVARFAGPARSAGGDPTACDAEASLTAASTEIGDLDPNPDITFNFDGPPTLVDQIKGGAPADVLATADEANMAKATEASIVKPDLTHFATNAGVLIVPKGNPAQVTGLDSSLDGTKLVICAPAVPCGATAKKIADDQGVTLKPVSEEQKVTDVRGKVSSGEADAGIVFATDAKSAGGAVETDGIHPDTKFATRYPMAIVADSTNADAAQAFIELVTSEQGQAVLAEYGFGAP